MLLKELRINAFCNSDQEKVHDLVLKIQNDEFNLGFTENEQPDLLDIEEYYKNGGFWTAKINDEVIGTIGLQYLESQNGVLRKMFVRKDYRGRQFNIAQQLFDILKDFALNKKIKTIWLDTPSIAAASHKFYERNGFKETDKLNLPDNYLFPDRNSKIYTLRLE